MAINQILPFGLVPSANVLSPEEYADLGARAGGFQSGVARSSEVNTPLRQTSFVASALAQYIVERSGLDVLDDGDVTGLVGKLIAALAASPAFTGTPTAPTPAPQDNSSRVATTAFVEAALASFSELSTESRAGLIRLATTALAQAMVDDGTALTPRKLADSFKGANQQLSGQGFQKLPGGLILQWGELTITNTGNITFPSAFPNGVLNVSATAMSAIDSTTTSSCFVELAVRNAGQMWAKVIQYDGRLGTRGIHWTALGW